jgi:hypothetical protein
MCEVVLTWAAGWLVYTMASLERSPLLHRHTVNKVLSSEMPPWAETVESNGVQAVRSLCRICTVHRCVVSHSCVRN